MNRLLRILPIMLGLFSMSAFADNITYTNLNVNFNISPNDGSGDNVGGTILGPGVNLLAGGGIPADWFNNDVGYQPGSEDGGPTTIYFDFGSGKIGSLPYDSFDSYIVATSFNAGSFVFPTNGQDFSVSFRASIAPINGAICSNGPCQTFTLMTRPGTVVLSFYYSPYTGLYYGGSGSFSTNNTPVPEPGTLGLMAIGLAAVVAFTHKRKPTLA